MDDDAIEAPTGYFQEQFVADNVGGRSNQTLALGWRIRGACDEARVVRALDALVARHEALRTSVVAAGSSHRQRIRPPEPAHSRTRVLAAGAALEVVAVAEADAPFDVLARQLARATLVRVGKDDLLALLTMHHAIADGWSCVVLDRELRSLLGGRAERLDGALPPLRAQFRDVVEHERSLDGAASRDFWLERLDRVGELDLPCVERAPQGGFQVHAHELSPVEAPIVRRLAEHARGVRTSFPTLVFAAVALSLVPYARRHLRLGVVHANRVRPEFRDVVGPVGDVLPLCLTLAPQATFRELLLAVRGEWIEALQHMLPFGRLNELAGNGGDWERWPLTDVGVNFFPAATDVTDAAPAANGCTFDVASIAAPLSRRRMRKRAWLEARVPISYLVAVDDEGGLGATLSVDPGVLPRPAVSVLGERFRRALAVVADDLDVSLQAAARELPPLP